MHRWWIPALAIVMLLVAQPALASQPAQGVVRDLADANNARCHNPEGITASPNGLLYAAGLSGNICIYTLSGAEVGHLVVAASSIPPRGSTSRTTTLGSAVVASSGSIQRPVGSSFSPKDSPRRTR